MTGAEIPALSLQTSDGNAFDLNVTLEEEPAVFIFYCGGRCPYCNAYLGQIKAAEEDSVAFGTRVIAVSPDQPEKLASARMALD